MPLSLACVDTMVLPWCCLVLPVFAAFFDPMIALS